MALLSLKKVWKYMQENSVSDSFALEPKKLDDGDLDYFHWEGFLVGPTDTPYQDGIFKLEARFPMDFPFKGPAFTLKTQIYHPNISSNGTIYRGDAFIHAGLTGGRGIQEALLQMVDLLINPEVEKCMVPQIGHIFQHSRDEFEKTAREWTEKYAM